MKAIDRLYLYFENQGIKPTVFEAEIGLSSGYLSKQRSRGGDIGESQMIKIIENCHFLSLEWLFLGKGSMFKKEHSTKGGSIIYEKREEYNKISRIPVLDVNFAAGLTGFINDPHINTEEFISLPSNMTKANCHYAGIHVKGHSMSPTLYDSDKLIIRQLDPSEWVTMKDEYIYAVVNKEDGGFVKRIKNRFSQGFIVCMSDNVDKSTYPNFNVNAEDIISVWQADWHISAKMPNINESYFSRLKRLEDRVDLLARTK